MTRTTVRGKRRKSGSESEEQGGADPRLVGRCVLVVDDDQRIRELMALLLRSEGFETVELCDGMEALKYLAVADVYHSDLVHPELIVADINMPKFSGIDLLMGMRECPNRPPVMLVTGVKDDEIHQEARRLGAVAVVKKPFDVDHFLETVDHCLTSPRIEAVIPPQIMGADTDPDIDIDVDILKA